MGVQSGAQKSNSKGTQTVTPQAPTWLSTPWQDVAEKSKGLLDPVALPTPSVGPSALQQQAFARAGAGSGTVTPGLLSDIDLSKYMNPYTSGVIDASTADLDRARRMAMVGTSAASSAGGSQAWMGDRAGVADSETNRGFLDQVASLAANLRSQAFQNAQSAAQYDLDAKLGADKFNVESARADTAMMSAEGDKQRQLALESDPYNAYLRRLADYAAMIGKIPSELFTGQTTTASSKGSGMSAGVGLNF